MLFLSDKAGIGLFGRNAAKLSSVSFRQVEHNSGNRSGQDASRIVQLIITEVII